jgi:general secretion pathway protein D
MILSAVVRKPSVSVKAVCSCLLLLGMTNSLPVDARNHATSKHRPSVARNSDGGFESANVSADGNYYGPVRSNDSLSAIASYFAQRRDCSPQQMRELIFQHNPQAFIDGNIKKLKLGAQLLIPDLIEQSNTFSEAPIDNSDYPNLTLKKSKQNRQTIDQIEFRDVLVGDTLKMLANEYGVNIVASKEASQIAVTMFLKNVTAMDVIDAIAKTYNLWYQKDPESGIVRLYTVKEYRLEQVEYKAEETEVFTMKNAKNALDLAETIQNLFSSRVKLSYGRSQTELILDLQQRFSRFDYVDRRSVQRFNSGGGGSGGAGGSRSSSGQNSNSSGGMSGMGGMSGGGMNGMNAMGGMNGMNPMGGNMGQGNANNQNLQTAEPSVDAMSKTLKNLNQKNSDSGLMLSGDSEDTKDLVDMSLRQQAPIYVGVIKHQNRVLVRTRDSDAMNEIRSIYKRLDIESSMLLMEVKILSIDLSDGFNSLFNLKLKNGAFTTGTNSQANNMLTNSSASAADAAGNMAAGALQAGAAAFNPALLATVVSKNFEASLQLLQEQNRVTELATPILLTSNQEVSRFFVGSDKPIVNGWSSGSVQTTGGLTNNTITVSPQPTYENRAVGNTLLLTPNINADNTVNIQVLVEQSTVLPQGGTMLVNVGDAVQSVPIDIVNEKTFSGSVIAKDNATVAVGGLIQENLTNRQNQVPILGEIPLLGFLFSETGKNRSRNELVVLIKPHIITSMEEAQRISADVMKQNSIHPSSQQPKALDIYSNKDQEATGYKLEQPFKEFINQDSLERYQPGNRSNPLR